MLVSPAAEGPAMKMWTLVIGLGVAVLGGVGVWRLAGTVGREAEAPPKEDGDGIAVVELFTSEGCSSCPPADAVLGELVQDARTHGRRIFPLAFHVDYWNRLGWADRFGDAANSHRQNNYAEALKSERVYTPQIIVNGAEEFVGSDKEQAKKTIAAALKKPASATVKLGVKKEKEGLEIAFEVAGAPQGAVLNIAVAERGLETKVRRGENEGRSLRHDNVVRAFRTVQLSDGAKGTVELTPPADVVRKNAAVVAFVQEHGNGAVLGATAVDLDAKADR
jgi:hypothetical protein